MAWEKKSLDQLKLDQSFVKYSSEVADGLVGTLKFHSK